jgi:SAM-dependent methyltransferase
MNSNRGTISSPARSNRSRAQEDVNRKVYNAEGVYRSYLSNVLTPPEIVLLLKYQPHICGRDVLEIGVGAGRTARYLAPLARHYTAVDYSPVMVRYMKQAMPDLNVQEANFRNLDLFSGMSFDFLLATDNVIDALPHEERLSALRESNRVLRPGGLLAFSSHNISFRSAFSGPRLKWSRNPLDLAANSVHYVWGIWNHLRVAPLRRKHSDYALLNDEGHHYACLHYYAARDTVGQQLEAANFRLLEVLTVTGQALDELADDSYSPSLLYVASRA